MVVFLLAPDVLRVLIGGAGEQLEAAAGDNVTAAGGDGRSIEGAAPDNLAARNHLPQQRLRAIARGHRWPVLWPLLVIKLNSERGRMLGQTCGVPMSLLDWVKKHWMKIWLQAAEIDVSAAEEKHRMNVQRLGLDEVGIAIS